MYDSTTVAEHLRGLLENAVGAPLPLDDPAARAASLWNLGLTSAGFMRLLAEAEDAFGIEWDLDEPTDAFSSYDALLAHVTAHLERRAAKAGGVA
ncbi:phosphopantetheine-binding protein [Streptomyces sp. GXMU-J15]|uniref:Phosphopantetheine-binding protein n=1 Tax=Streptomyces fuscus TaxID=3048495 RepID=A0ABT7J597_9ACTN|nr:MULTISPECIES: phosphopantetheine-binding protein [Streptomyces]MDL2078748.1 phosphopantetheine-binding protein [Streptomyces fuscus]SBT95543.1 Phosphopantetheine attachment site [Streptomyces sp. DI166]